MAQLPSPSAPYGSRAMAKDTEKLIRQLSLISYLMAERRPVTAQEIRLDVEGYSAMNEDAFARRFYADRSELEQALLHIILSHHGSLEFGSPVVPCTREATLVHMIDNLGGRLGSFDRLEKELPAGQQWSGYDKALGGGAYFAAPAGVDRAAA